MTTPTPNTPDNFTPIQEIPRWRRWLHCTHPHTTDDLEVRFVDHAPDNIIQMLNQAYTFGHHAADNSHPLTSEQAEQNLDKLREALG